MDTQLGFFEKDQHLSAYGKDFFDWYHQSLKDHGRLLLQTAADVFQNSRSAFRHVALGAKIPGVHWRVGSDRLAEVMAGLIPTSRARDWNDFSAGHGYRSLLSVFSDFAKRRSSHSVVVHFTCLEKGNGEGGAAAASRAEDLVFWVGEEARRQKLLLKGENAIELALANEYSWDRIRNALTWSSYAGFTFLRLEGLVTLPDAWDRLKALVREFRK